MYDSLQKTHVHIMHQSSILQQISRNPLVPEPLTVLFNMLESSYLSLKPTQALPCKHVNRPVLSQTCLNCVLSRIVLVLPLLVVSTRHSPSICIQPFLVLSIYMLSPRSAALWLILFFNQSPWVSCNHSYTSPVL